MKTNRCHSWASRGWAQIGPHSLNQSYTIISHNSADSSRRGNSPAGRRSQGFPPLPPLRGVATWNRRSVARNLLIRIRCQTIACSSSLHVADLVLGFLDFLPASPRHRPKMQADQRTKAVAPVHTSGTAGTWGTHANQLQCSTPRLPTGCIELSLGRHLGNTEQASGSTGQS